MVTLPIPMSPEAVFEAERYEPTSGAPSDTRARPLTRQNLSTSGSGRAFIRETARRATLANPPVLCLLAVDSDAEAASLTLPMLVDASGAPREYLLETPGTVVGLRIRMRLSSEDKRGEFSITTDYAGVSVDKVVSYARFLAALRREQGSFKLFAYHQGRPLPLATVELPLPFGEEDREHARQDLRFWESVHEVAEATGNKLIAPRVATEEDVKNLDRTLQVIRTGRLDEKIKDFTIPLPPETLNNLVQSVEREGAVVALALDFPNERLELFGTDIELGRCIRYVPKARLLNSPTDIREWLMQDHRPGESYRTYWVPVDDVTLRTVFSDWPKRFGPEPSRPRRKDLNGVTQRAREFADELSKARPQRTYSDSTEIIRNDRDSRT